MNSVVLALRPIGVVHSPHTEPAGTPIQPRYAADCHGEVEVDPAYEEALDDIDGFERIWLIYWLHRSRPYRAKIVPFRDTQLRGLFATRSPSRPNPIGMSVVRLHGREGNRLKISGVDIVDGTPLLDIKPYVPRFDVYPDAAAGWLDADSAHREQADDRFQEDDHGA